MENFLEEVTKLDQNFAGWKEGGGRESQAERAVWAPGQRLENPWHIWIMEKSWVRQKYGMQRGS